MQGCLLDQFGVLHDGKTAYAGAVDAVSALAQAGLKVLILSNSSRRECMAQSSAPKPPRCGSRRGVPAGRDAVVPKLVKLGFREADLAGAITSGEVAHRALEHRQGAFWTGLGRRCMHLTWGERGQVSLAGLDLEVRCAREPADQVTADLCASVCSLAGAQVVTSPDQADFILASGTECLGRGEAGPAEPVSLDDVRSLLEHAARRGGIPMLVANPDVVTVSGGGLVPMPGTFAKWYAELGGEVRSVE